MKENKKTDGGQKGYRKWIRILLGAYLLLLAALTFFSNYFQSVTVPHVNSCKIEGALIEEEYYDMTVPTNACCYDEQHGWYVFEVVRKKTPLGERCYLNKVNVDLLKTDTAQGIVAISAQLGRGDEVVKDNDSQYCDKDIVVVERILHE